LLIEFKFSVEYFVVVASADNICLDGIFTQFVDRYMIDVLLEKRFHIRRSIHYVRDISMGTPASTRAERVRFVRAMMVL